MTTMLYRSPGPHKRSETETFDCCIVDDADLAATVASGWHYTVRDALAAANNPQPEADEKPKRGRPRKSEAL